MLCATVRVQLSKWAVQNPLRTCSLCMCYMWRASVRGHHSWQSDCQPGCAAVPSALDPFIGWSLGNATIVLACIGASAVVPASRGSSERSSCCCVRCATRPSGTTCCCVRARAVHGLQVWWPSLGTAHCATFRCIASFAGASVLCCVECYITTAWATLVQSQAARVC